MDSQDLDIKIGGKLEREARGPGTCDLFLGGVAGWACDLVG